MAGKPHLKKLKLEPCCAKALDDINEKLKTAAQLRAALAAGPFIAMLGSNPLGVLFTITMTDWENLTAATRAIGPIARDRCQTIAQLHSFDHPGGDLNRFWVAMAESFA